MTSKLKTLGQMTLDCDMTTHFASGATVAILGLHSTQISVLKEASQVSLTGPLLSHSGVCDAMSLLIICFCYLLTIQL